MHAPLSANSRHRSGRWRVSRARQPWAPNASSSRAKAALAVIRSPKEEARVGASLSARLSLFRRFASAGYADYSGYSGEYSAHAGGRRASSSLSLCFSSLRCSSRSCTRRARVCLAGRGARAQACLGRIAWTVHACCAHGGWRSRPIENIAPPKAGTAAYRPHLEAHDLLGARARFVDTLRSKVPDRPAALPRLSHRLPPPTTELTTTL